MSEAPPDAVARALGVGGLSRHVFICGGPACCDEKAGDLVWSELKAMLLRRGLSSPGGGVLRTKVKCLRICARGPIMVVYPEGVWYQDVTLTNLGRIVDEHFVGGRVVEELCFARDGLGKSDKA